MLGGILAVICLKLLLHKYDDNMKVIRIVGIILGRYRCTILLCVEVCLYLLQPDLKYVIYVVHQVAMFLAVLRLLVIPILYKHTERTSK